MAKRSRKDSFRFELIGVRACLPALVRRVLRVSGSGLKSHCASAPVPPEPLQPVRHVPDPPVPSRNVHLTAKPDALILHKIMSSSTYTISQAQAKLPRLIKEDSFAISVHGEVKGFYLSKQRLEAMIESIELLENPEFTAALKAHRSGRAKTYTVKELDEKFSA